MAFKAPNPEANPAGSTQTPDGIVIADGAPVFDRARGHLMPAGSTDRPDHHVARSGEAGHQRG